MERDTPNNRSAALAADYRQPAAGGALTPLDAPAAIGAGIIAALVVLVFWDFLWRQVRFAFTEQADWGHTLIIPFIAGYFVFRNWGRIVGSETHGESTAAVNGSGPVFRTTWIALIPMVLGVGVYLFSSLGPQAFNHHNLKGAGFGLALFGVVLLFAGFSAMRWLWFPLAYLIVFGQTISREAMHIVTFKMQDIAAVGSEVLFTLMGMDVTRSGNIVTLFYNGVPHPLNIAEACSGMRMLMAFMALGVAMAYTGLSRNWQRVLLVALAVPIAIFVNMLRVVTLGILSIFDSEFAAGDFHTFVGLVWLVPAFLLFLGAMWMVKKIVVEPEDTDSSSSAGGSRSLVDLFDSRARIAFVVACAALLLSGLGFRVVVAQLNIFLNKEAVELREKFPTIPGTLDRWQALGSDRQFDAAVVETLGTDEYFDRTYVRRDFSFNDMEPGQVPPVVNVHLAYYTGMIDAIPHIPDRCFLAGGFARVDLPVVLDVQLDASAWSLDPAGKVNRASGEPYRVVRFEHRITGRPMHVRLPIGIALENQPNDSAEADRSPYSEGLLPQSSQRGTLRLRTSEFRIPDQPDSRLFAGFFFIANGHVTPYPHEVRLLAFDRTDKYAYYCKVQLTMEGGPSFDHETFAQIVGDLLDDLLPEIMRCLPDWSEVERRDQESLTH